MNNAILQTLLDEKEQGILNQFYHYTQVNFCYNSNHIEGSRLSEFQTNYIFEYEEVPTQDSPIRVNDVIEARNHFRAFDFILENADYTIDTLFLKQLHAIVKRDSNNISTIGDFKRKQNFVGDMKTTPPHLVAQHIEKLLKSYNAKTEVDLNNIVDFHYHFEKIHPFEDGNGRVGRLIMFKECLKHNVVPFIIDEEHKLFYYRGLKEYPQTKGYLIDTCLACQDKYKEKIAYFEIEQNQLSNDDTKTIHTKTQAKSRGKR